MVYRYLSLQELLDIHAEILRNTGGEKGTLFHGNLELCVATPKRKEYGFEPYSNILEKAASLLYEINKLHPFVDGNKRTAYSATSTFLNLNGYEVEAQVNEAVDLSLTIAKCRFTIAEVINWVQNHAKKK